MKASKSSRTAEQMALSRAIETRKPASERICDDPLAERFLSVPYRLLLLGRPLRDALERMIERLFAGHHYYVIARTRCFDEFLREALEGKPEQLVILGAGYDSRAHRFAALLTGVAVFEVDHPATSAAKQSQVRRALGANAGPVTYVPVDFNTQKLADRLRNSGYRDGRKTVFLWEGVTPYLTASAVDDTLAFITSSSAPGSSLIFDYILSSVVSGNCTMRGARNEFEKMQQTSEPLTFGIDEGQAAPFLSARKFVDVRDIGADDLKRKYFSGASAERYVKPWWRIAQATVA